MTSSKSKTVPSLKDRRAETSKENGSKGGRPSNPELTEMADQMRLRFFTHEPTRHPVLRHWRGTWYGYNTHGWSPLPEEAIQKQALSFMQDRCDGRTVGMSYITSLLGHLTSYNMVGLDPMMQVPAYITTRKSAKGVVSFENGLSIDIEKLASGSPSAKTTITNTIPDLFILDKVDYPYDPKAKCPKFMKYLKRVLPTKDGQLMAQQMFGLCMADTTRFEVFFYLYGPTARNGKTVMVNILRNLVGKHLTSYVLLQSLAERFETWPLAESKVNIQGDMTTDIGHGNFLHMEGLFKDLVSGGNIEYQKKNKDKFNAPCRSRFIFAGNSLPTFIDKSDALWQRLRVLHFPVQIPEKERNPNLADQIIGSELSGVFNWALEGLRSVLRNNRVEETQESRKIKDEHRLDCDRELMFLKEYGYEKGSMDDTVDSTNAYQMYSRWMKDNGHMPLSSTKFFRRLFSQYPGIGRKQKEVFTEKGRTTRNVIVGLKIKESK